jgi:hypothetical protein
MFMFWVVNVLGVCTYFVHATFVSVVRTCHTYAKISSISVYIAVSLSRVTHITLQVAIAVYAETLA